jgi:MFS superfamily sulfate permease-like transporter
LSYRFADDFRHDLLAGVSVAAVALPVAIAYAQLAGFNPVVGLYSSILPLVAYAIFGTSRQMIVNPDAAVCAMVAAAVAPLAGGNADLYWSLSVAGTFLAGMFCIVASFFRLGALAEFLSRPILVGLLNGVAISICLGQVGKLLGFSIESKRVIPQLIEIFAKLPQTQIPTLIVGAASLAILFGLARWAPRLPTAAYEIGAGARQHSDFAEALWPAVVAAQRLLYRLYAFCWRLEEVGSNGAANVARAAFGANGQASLKAAIEDLSNAITLGGNVAISSDVPDFL